MAEGQGEGPAKINPKNLKEFTPSPPNIQDARPVEGIKGMFVNPASVPTTKATPEQIEAWYRKLDEAAASPLGVARNNESTPSHLGLSPRRKKEVTTKEQGPHAVHVGRRRGARPQRPPRSSEQ